MDLIKRSLSRWIQAALILVIGILCIVAGASGNGNPNTAQNATDAISIVIGIVLIVIGALDHIEVWNRKDYEEYEKNADSSFETIAEELSGNED